jgi:cell division protein FtsB
MIPDGNALKLEKENSGKTKPYVLPREKAKTLRWPLIATIACSCLFIYAFGREYINYLNLKEELGVYGSILAEAEDDYDLLQEKKALLFNNDYIEQIARKNLGMIKRGEILVYPTEKGGNASGAGDE